MPDAERLYLDLLKKALTASLYPESGWKALGRERDSSVRLASPLRWLREQSRHVLARVEALTGLSVVRRASFDEAARREGRDWPLFAYTMVGHARLDNLQHCIEQVLDRNVPGDLVEAGAWRGGATIFMRALLRIRNVTDRTVWVADSFEGLPPADPANPKETGPDFSQVRYLKVSLDEVKASFRRFGLLDDQVRFLKGWFQETLPEAPIDRIAVLRLDGDLYDSTMAILKSLYRKVVPGGYVIVDDYRSWAPCKQAVDDFLAGNGIEVEMLPIDWTAVYWRVPGDPA